MNEVKAFENAIDELFAFHTKLTMPIFIKKEIDNGIAKLRQTVMMNKSLERENKYLSDRVKELEGLLALNKKD